MFENVLSFIFLNFHLSLLFDPGGLHFFVFCFLYNAEKIVNSMKI
jgi:hypothetical protein